MHILIDKERMVFLRKHASIDVLANLAWIESHDVVVALFPIDSARPLSMFTELELRTLYFNTTGVEFPQNKYPQLIQILYDIMYRLPPDEVNAFEVEAQAVCVNDDARHKYKYVKGATKPSKKADLFEPEARMISRDENEELMAMNGRLPAVEAMQKKAATTHHTSPTVKTGPTVVVTGGTGKKGKVSEAASVSPPPTSLGGKSKKEIIWSVTGQLWKEAGSPTEVPKILAIRKKAMDVLEREYAISRTSASSSLANWQKEILS